jgi:3D (Asp-Asp-Asp) domain-containing protein
LKKSSFQPFIYLCVMSFPRKQNIIIKKIVSVFAGMADPDPAKRDWARGKNIKKEFKLKVEIRVVLVLLIMIAVVTVGLSMVSCMSQRIISSSVSAKVDEPINPDKSVREPEPIKNLIQCDELISVGESKKDEEEKLESARESKILATLEVIPSGYYTPERGQPRYADGSYERDIVRNGWGNKTSTGVKPTKGKTVAADPSLLPSGTKVRLRGLPGTYEVEDRGSAIKGKKIDIYTGRGYQGLKDAMALRKKDKKGKLIRLIVEVLEYPHENS